MKNHIIFKFLAILLCAAFLLGAVASGVGIFVMTEADLYQKTAEEAYRDTQEDYAQSYAGNVAAEYAAKELGGANDRFLNSYYGSYWTYDVFRPDRIGYVLKDAEGSVLLDRSLGEETPAEYSFTLRPYGNYMNVLSEMTEAEYRGTVELPEPSVSQEGNIHIYHAIPEGGAEIYYVEMQFADGSTEGIGAYEDYLGTIYDNGEGVVEFFSAEGVNLLEGHLQTQFIYLAFMTRDGQLVYEISGNESILQEGRYENGMTYLLLRSGEEAFVYDAIPPEGCAVANVYVEYADGFAESVGGSPEVGRLDYEDGGWVRFVANGHLMTPNNQTVTHIKFEDTDGILVFEARDPEGVGHMYVGEEGHWFRSSMVLADTPVEETVPEATEVTIPETLSGIVKAHTNIYASASLSSPVTGFLTTGSPVEIAQQVTEEGLHWGWIPASGWVLMDGIELPTEDLPDNAPEDSDPELFVEVFQAEVQKNQDIYSGPNATSEVVGAYAKDMIVSVMQTEIANGEEWALTDLGWIPMDCLIQVELPVMEFELEMMDEPSASTEETIDPTEETEAPEGTIATEPVIDFGVAAEASVEATSLYADVEVYRYYDSSARTDMYVEYTYEPLPEYTVEVALASNAFQYEHEWVLIRLVYGLKNQLAYILGASLLLFAVFAVYLCCAAGKRPGTKEIHAGGLNAMPLELYAFLATCGVAGLGVVGVEGTRYLLRSHTINGLLCGGLCAYGVCLLIVAFCFGCAAQFKTPGGYWWRNSLTGRCIRLLGKGGKLTLKGMEKLDEKWDSKLWPGIKKLFMGLIAVATVLLKKLWKLAMGLFHWLEAMFRKLGKAMNRFFSMLPLTWQWLLVGFGMFLLMAMVFATNGEEVLVVICIGICIGIIIYGAHCFGILLESAKRMSKGDLDEKVDDKLMVGSFKDFAGELNGLADVAVVAAQKQLKSERMKTELITNVSHDIKTPLTSIINYVDLLQKPHTEDQQAQYLEVLDRQSHRLKKLIDDLMEMSKASTGNMSVDITRVDAAEAVNQALGEFADKLDKARLYPVFRQPEESVYMMADGRLVWRVMSNLLSNAVKYALPGTRLYVDLQKVDSKVIISMKNISREELNVEADELLERFVRGDASRNTEGSGLGLNIAQSLMELQKGQLQILVDGDLFKVTLIFPGE